MTYKILIVEDEAVVGMEIQKILEEIGYSVPCIPGSGQKALQAAIEIQPDLILMDIRIRGEMDGIETARQIKSRLNIPIVFLTAHAEDDVLNRAKQVEPFGYILKPFQERDIRVTVEMALYAARLDRERREALDELQQMQRELEEKVRQRTAELEIAKSLAEEANQSKSDCFASISHELRSPLHNILSFARLGRMRGDELPREKIIWFYDAIEKSGMALLKLVEDLLDLSKLEAGKMVYELAEFNLDRIVLNIINECQLVIQEKEIATRLHLIDDSRLVCDPNRIGQVIRNLVVNAIKFSPRGGRIEVILKTDSLADAHATDGPEPALRLSILDEGAGIPDNELEAVFDKFVQSTRTNYMKGGTGLGLAICREIVQHHAGRIWAENRSGGGAEFSFILPRTQKRHAPMVVPAGKAQCTVPEGRHVLKSKPSPVKDKAAAF